MVRRQPARHQATINKNRANVIYAKSRTRSHQRAFRAADKALDAVLTAKENEYWIQQFVSPANTPRKLPGGATAQPNYSHWSAAGKAIRGCSKYKGYKKVMIQDPQGVQATTTADSVRNMATYFHSIFEFPQRAAGRQHLRHLHARTPDRSYLSPRNHEVLAAIKALRKTAPGRSGIPMTVWKVLGTSPEIIQIISEFLRSCWDKRTVPSDWLTGYLAALYKKDDPSLASNFRLILVEDHLSKIYQWVLNQRLDHIHEDICPEFSNGFRSRCGCTDALYIFKQILRKRKEHGQDSWVLFLDIIKAFDKVDRGYLWEILLLLGEPPPMVEVLQSLFVGRQAELNLDGETATFAMNGGCGQGMILAPRLFSFFMYAVLQK